MHNCKATRETLIALALNPPDLIQSLPADFETCAPCREEYASLRNAVRLADQAKQTALPGESFWPGYHTRLRQRLQTAGKSPAFEPRTSVGTRLTDLFTSSVRVPVPLVAALLVVLSVSIVFALNSRRSLSAAPPIIVTKTVEVPVTQETIREKLITRVVYRQTDRRPAPAAQANTIAVRRNEPAEIPISLVGFKPTNEVKLTIIKGSYRDEK